MDKIGRTVAEVIEAKELFHLMDDVEISKLLDEQPEIMAAIEKNL